MNNRYISILLALTFLLLAIFLIVDAKKGQSATAHSVEQETVQMR